MPDFHERKALAVTYVNYQGRIVSYKVYRIPCPLYGTKASDIYLPLAKMVIRPFTSAWCSKPLTDGKPKTARMRHGDILPRHKQLAL